MSNERINVGYVLAQLGRAVASGGDVAKWQHVLAGMAGGTLSIGTRAPVKDTPPWVTLEVAHGGFATGRFAAAGAAAGKNAYYLSDAGRAELVAMLHAGTYRIEVPEEGALMAVAWLAEKGEHDRAVALVETLLPFFERLRFYPQPHATPLQASANVSLQTVGDTVKTLQRKRPQQQLARMHESLLVWRPLYDQTVALFGETRNAAWSDRGRALLQAYEQARKTHVLCKWPHKPKERYFKLRQLLALAVDKPLTGTQLPHVRHLIAGHAPRDAPPPTPLHHALAHDAATRLSTQAQDTGLADVSAFAQLPQHLFAVVQRCWQAPLPKLVETGVVPSAEVMARLVPHVAAHARATAIDEPALRRWYESEYAAFRRRRSVLLLDLESQVGPHELPWITALEPWLQQSPHMEHTTFNQVARTALEAFPHAITPNKLVKELRVLAKAAKAFLPLCDEIAADIFMGTFSEVYLRAAKVAATLLRGTLYARYYGLPIDAVIALDDIQEVSTGVAVSPGFAALCAPGKGRGVAHNGATIERAQILTTHNLAVLTQACGPLPYLALSQRSFMGCKRKLQSNRRVAAQSWRQMVFFLSLCTEAEQHTFSAWVHERQTLSPELRGLFDGLSGTRPFLGWHI